MILIPFYFNVDIYRQASGTGEAGGAEAKTAWDEITRGAKISPLYFVLIFFSLICG